MFKRLSSILVAGALVAAPALTAAPASANDVLLGDIFKNAKNKVEKCQKLDNAIMGIVSTQGVNPFIVGTHMTPVTDKSKVNLEPSLHIKVKEGSKGADYPLEWNWGPAMKRYAKIRDSASDLGCELTKTKLLDVTLYSVYKSGKSAQAYVDKNAKMKSHLFQSVNRVPNYVSYKNGVVHIAPQSVKRSQSAVVNLEISVQAADSWILNLPLVSTPTVEYQLPIRVTHLPKDSKVETGVDDNSNKGGSSIGGGDGNIFDKLFSFSS